MADSDGGVANWLVDLIMKPGTAVKLVPAINAILVLLLILLTGLVASGQASIHVFIMGFLSVGLMASVNWFMSEYKKVKMQQEQESTSAGDTVSTTTASAAMDGTPAREKAD